MVVWLQPCESRSLSGTYQKPPVIIDGRGFCFWAPMTIPLPDRRYDHAAPWTTTLVRQSPTAHRPSAKRPINGPRPRPTQPNNHHPTQLQTVPSIHNARCEAPDIRTHKVHSVPLTAVAPSVAWLFGSSIHRCQARAGGSPASCALLCRVGLLLLCEWAFEMPEHSLVRLGRIHSQFHTRSVLSALGRGHIWRQGSPVAVTFRESPYSCFGSVQVSPPEGVKVW